MNQAYIVMAQAMRTHVFGIFHLLLLTIAVIVAYITHGIGGVLAAIAVVGFFILSGYWLVLRLGKHAGFVGAVLIFLIFLAYTFVVFLISDDAFDSMMFTLDKWVASLTSWNDLSLTNKLLFIGIATVLGIGVSYLLDKISGE